MSLTPKQLRQVEELYFGLVKGKENLADAHRNNDDNLIEQWKEYVESVKSHLAELLPPELDKDDKHALMMAFEQLVQLADDGEETSPYYRQVEGYVEAILPGFLERETNREDGAAADSRQIAVAEPREIIEVGYTSTEIAAPSSARDKTLRFTEALGSVTQNTERIRELFEDIESESDGAIYELNKLKEQPRIDKASRREYRKRLRIYHRSHDKFIGKKISKGLACFTAIFLGTMLFVMEFFVILMSAEVLLSPDMKMPEPAAKYLLTFYKDLTPIIFSPGKDDTVEDWELFTAQEYYEWKQFHRQAFSSWEHFKKDGYKDILKRQISKSTVVVLIILAILTFWSCFALGRRSSMNGFTVKQYNKLKIPLFTSDNKRRQIEIEHIAHNLGRQVPKLVRLGNALLRAEYRKQQWNENLMGHMTTIDSFGKSVRKLTLCGQIKEAKRASRADSGVNAGGILALVGGVLLACVGIAAAVALPSEYRVTTTDAYGHSETHSEWH
jgi:hypothetical protein